MKSYLVTALFVALCLNASTSAFAQSTVGTITGIVTDTSTAALPGVTVRVLNADTGVSQSMLTNDSGSYSFILPPGTNYTITAELRGFKKATVTSVTLRMAAEQRIDVSLEVGDIQVDVVVDAKKGNPLLDLPAVGVTLDETQIQGLPLVGNDPLALIATLPGYRASPLGHQFDTVGGLPMYMMNTVRDGLSVTDGFSSVGVSSNTILNQDMISEIRLILAPVDAEAGRGNGQVQITTKSGTNKFQWNINYNLRQNALNALGPSTTRFKQPFGATFQYIVSVGGPIWKNHTFYFVNFDHQLRWERAASNQTIVGFTGSGGQVAVPVLTEQSRNGIFRYFDGWNPTNNANFAPTTGSLANSTAGAWPNEMFLAPNGQYLPVAPQIWADNLEGTAAYTGALRCFSVFGNIKFDGSPFDPAKDCGLYIPRTGDPSNLSSWSPNYANPILGVGILPNPALHPNIPDPTAPGGVRVTWEGACTVDPVSCPTGLRLFDRPPDRTGYAQRLIAHMPRPNQFSSSAFNGGQLNSSGFFNAVGTVGNDTLNRAQFNWVRSTSGRDNQNTFRGGTFGYGTGLDQALVGHKVVNLKIDHNLGNHTRISFGTSIQNDLNSRLYFQSRWPDDSELCPDAKALGSDTCGVNGYAARVPRVLTVNGITTISNTMVNEARFGWNFNRSTQLAPWENPNQSIADFARSFLSSGWIDPNNSEASPVYFLPGSTSTGFGNFADNVLPYGTTGANNGLQTNSGLSSAGPQSSSCTPVPFASIGADNASGLSTNNCESGSALYNFANTLSWNRRGHSIRVGGELRLTRAHESSGQVLPQAAGGPSAGTVSDLASITAVPEMLGFSNAGHGGRLQTSATSSAELLYLLSGSVASVSQSFWVNNLDNFRLGTWETWSTGEGRKARNTVQNEMAFFVKDDWKITKSLTLNLGVRYENYGNLYMKGFTTGIQDEGYGLFGPARARMTSGNPMDYWLTPGNLIYTGYGRTPPNINVAGLFLPNGAPSYIPGNCLLGEILEGSNTTATNDASIGAAQTCTSVGGSTVQFVPGTTPTGGFPITTIAVNCVHGVVQNPFLPVSNCDPTLLTSRIFVGPDSDHPKQAALYRDRNNIGPAIGFSYRLGLGRRTVLIRGGFQFTYGSAGRDRSVGTGTAGQLSQQGGGGESGALDQITHTCTGSLACLGLQNTTHAMVLADLPDLIPLQTQLYNNPNYARPSVGASGAGNLSFSTVRGTTRGDNVLLIQNFGVWRALSATAYAPGYQDPRTENYTFSVSTNLSRASTLALSYVGTLGRNRPTGVNLNMPNVYHNPELLEALNVTRAGGDHPLFDQMFAGLNLTGITTGGWAPVGRCGNVAGAPGVSIPERNITCPAGTVYNSGSAHLRNITTQLDFNNVLGTSGGTAVAESIRTDLANGNYQAVGYLLATISQTQGGDTNSSLQAIGYRSIAQSTGLGTPAGALLRNGCDRLGSATTANRLDVIGSTGAGLPAQGNLGQVRCFPEDYLIMNPGLSVGNAGLVPGTSTSLGRGVVYKDNWGYTNYHQFQAQYTLRLSSANLQATYLTSKTLALPRDFYKTNTVLSNPLGGVSLGSITGFSDPQTEESRRRDYGLSSDSQAHAIRLNGIFQLPFGPGKPLLRNAPGIVTKILSGWQMGIIYNAQSGAPFSIQAGDMLYGSSSGVSSTAGFSGCSAYLGTATGSSGFANQNCQSGLSFPDVVSPLWTNPRGKLVRNIPDDAPQDPGGSSFFGYPSPFAVIKDPQCTGGTVSPALEPNFSPVGRAPLSSLCNLGALVMKVPVGTPGAFPLNSATPLNAATSYGTDDSPVLIMLQNPMPGKQGSLGAQTMRQPGRYYLDANLSKRVMFTESRGVEIRLDATNVLNHPAPSDMFLNLGPTLDSADSIVSRFNASTANRSSIGSGCGGLTNNVFCGRQVQFSFRMINN